MSTWWNMVTGCYRPFLVTCAPGFVHPEARRTSDQPPGTFAGPPFAPEPIHRCSLCTSIVQLPISIKLQYLAWVRAILLFDRIYSTGYVPWDLHNDAAKSQAVKAGCLVCLEVSDEGPLLAESLITEDSGHLRTILQLFLFDLCREQAGTGKDAWGFMAGLGSSWISFAAWVLSKIWGSLRWILSLHGLI